MSKSIEFNINQAWTHSEITQTKHLHFRWACYALLGCFLAFIPLMIVLARSKMGILGNEYLAPHFTLYIRFSWVFILICLITAICQTSMMLPFRKIRLNDVRYQHLTRLLQSYQSKRYPHALQKYVQLAVNYVTHCYATRNYITHSEMIAIKRFIESQHKSLNRDF